MFEQVRVVPHQARVPLHQISTIHGYEEGDQRLEVLTVQADVAQGAFQTSLKTNIIIIIILKRI